MLPSKLKALKTTLSLKPNRTVDEKRLLKELEELDINSSKDLIEGIEKRANASVPVYGPGGGSCPTCGNPW